MNIKAQFYNKFIEPWLDPVNIWLAQFYIAPTTFIGLLVIGFAFLGLWNWRKVKAKNNPKWVFIMVICAVGFAVIYEQVQFITQHLSGN